MIRMIALLLSLLLAAPALAVEEPPASPGSAPTTDDNTPTVLKTQIPADDIVLATVDGLIRPGFHQLAVDAAALDDDVKALCATPSAAALAAAQSGFRATALSFARVEFVFAGPLGESSRYQQLMFWPDPKGIALRQIQQVLGKKDATATDPVTLKHKSIALQGLVALEYLLYGTGSNDLTGPSDGYRCRFAAAIAALTRELTQTMDAEWAADGPGSILDQLLNPDPKSADYRTEGEVLNKLAGTFIMGTETIRDKRVMPILAVNSGGPKPRAALYWRSGLTGAVLAANFAGLRDFYNAGRFSDAMGPDYALLASNSLAQLDAGGLAAERIVDPIETAVSKPDELQGLRDMVAVTQSLDTLIGEDTAKAMGLTIGFSMLDGD
jgi:predicted lipoprotein